MTRAGGFIAEEWIAGFLAHHGLEPVTRNFRCRVGEIDLIMRDGPVLVFIEVRHRMSDRFGSAIESITAAKRRKLLRTAQAYLQFRGKGAEPPCRFDVVAINGPLRLENVQWIKDAFQS